MRGAAPRRLPMKIRAPHKGKFLLDVIEQPIPLFQILHGDFSTCVTASKCSCSFRARSRKAYFAR
jgi:hypothetical protein